MNDSDLVHRLSTEIQLVIENGLEAGFTPTVTHLAGPDLRDGLSEAIEHGVRDERLGTDRSVLEGNRKNAARRLLGLDSTAPKTRRQEQVASRVLIRRQSVHRSTVERTIQPQLIAEVVTGLLCLAVEARYGRALQVLPGDENRVLDRHLRDRPAERVRYLELSLDSVKDPILATIRNGLAEEQQILIANPNSLTAFHRDRMYTALWDILNVLDRSPGNPTVKIRCYSRAPSLRGRAVYGGEGDGLVVVGWYTHEVRHGNPQHVTREEFTQYSWREIWGADNPLVTVSEGHPAFLELRTMHSRVFEDLWTGGQRGVEEHLSEAAARCNDKRFAEFAEKLQTFDER